MDIAITAIGTAVPEFGQSQQNVASFFSKHLELDPQETRRLKAIYRATGIDHRYSVIADFIRNKEDYEFFGKDASEIPCTEKRMELYQKNALPLAIKAIKDCLGLENGLRLSPENYQSLSANKYNEKDNILNSITHIITVSCTGMYAPGLDIEIIQHFKLSNTTHRTAINFMGCYGAFNAIKTAHAICSSNPKNKVLIVSLELCSLHIQHKKSWDHLLSGAIFSDGAGALVVETLAQSKKTLNKNSFNKNTFKLLNFYCDILPESQAAMTWRIANYGFDIILSSYVPDLIKSGIKKFTDRAFEYYDLKQRPDIYAIHPGGVKILKACEEALDLQMEDNQYSYEVLRKYGNMSSATIIFVLKNIWDQFQKNPSTSSEKNIFSCAFGPGLTLESMMLSIS